MLHQASDQFDPGLIPWFDMIQAVLFTNSEGHIWGFRIKGHAEYAADGEPDIVCAAVSALAYNTVNGLQQLCGQHVLCKTNDDGFMAAQVPLIRGGANSDKAELVFRLLYLGLKQLARQYRSNVTVKTVKHT